MFSNVRQGGNGEPNHHQNHIISETNSSTREQFGALQATEGTKSPYKNKDTSHKENITRSKNQGCLIEVLLLDSWENPQAGPYQRNLQFLQDKTPSRSNHRGKNERKQEVVLGEKVPRIGWRGEKHCSGEN